MNLRDLACGMAILAALSGCKKTVYVPVQPPVSQPAPAPVPSPTPPPVPEPPPDSVVESLGLLGVDTESTPRLSDDGVPLPEDFSPFGQRLKIAIDAAGNTRIGAPMELLVGGFSVEGSTAPLVVLDNLEMPSSGNSITPSVIYQLSAAQAPWANVANQQNSFEEKPPVTRRDGGAGDLDGDGYDELVIAHEQAGGVMLRITHLANRGGVDLVLPVPVPAALQPVGDVRVSVADLGGEGHAEILLGISQAAAAGRPTSSALLVLGLDSGNLAVRQTRNFESTLPHQHPVHVTMVLEPGNVDYDNAQELVLVLYEFVGTGPIPDQAATRFFVFDDADHGLEQRVADTLSIVSGAGTYHAQVADVAIGDIDDDLVGEIVFGGLAGLAGSRSCNAGDDGGYGDLRYLLIQYEYTGNGFSKSKTAFSHDSDANALYPSSCSGNDAASWGMRFLAVNILDFDNDRQVDIQANQFIFSGIPQQGWRWTQRAKFNLPDLVFMPDTNEDLVFDRNSAAILVQDVDGNGRDDFVTYRGGDEFIRVYSWREGQAALGAPPPPPPPELYQMATIAIDNTTDGVGFGPGRSASPLLIAFDADGLNEGDVQTLRFIEHQFAFTEPMVLAAIAAPPCAAGIGQMIDACTSSWGTAQATGTEAEREISVKAGITVGFEAEFQAGTGLVVNASTKVFGLSAKLVLEEELGFHTSESYEVTRSVSFETGSMEDSVVFMSIPYDFYNYEVIASTLVNMDDIGAVRELHRIGLPRTPVIRMADVDYYNSHTTDGAVKIADTVFDHTPGNLDSYPDVARRDQILATHRTQLDEIRIQCPGCWQLDPEAPIISGNDPNRTFDPVTALPGLVSDSIGVGQGSGATQVSIDFSRSSSASTSLAKSAELDVEFTIGFLVAGFQFGGGLSHTTTVSHGSSTSYVGTVGSIDAAHFATEKYRFGMFTYLQGDPVSGQEFEVINYWVE
jgi:hypothetical protein